MTKLLQRWTKKHRAQHEAKKQIVAAALDCLACSDEEGYPIEHPRSPYARLMDAARALKKART